MYGIYGSQYGSQRLTHSNRQNDLSAAFRTPRLVLPLQTMDGVITTRGSPSRRRRDPGYAATHTPIALYCSRSLSLSDRNPRTHRWCIRLNTYVLRDRLAP